jgi:hypothetical protein
MNPPTFDSVKDCIVTYHDQCRNRLDPMPQNSIIYGAAPEVEYRSTKSYGSWFEWWNTSVHFVADIDNDGCGNQTQYKRIEMCLKRRSYAIRELVEEFPDVIVYAKQTGLIWPNFVYMDNLPTVLLRKGVHFEIGDCTL